MSSNSNLTTMRRLVEQLKLEASVERIKHPTQSTAQLQQYWTLSQHPDQRPQLCQQQNTGTSQSEQQQELRGRYKKHHGQLELQTQTEVSKAAAELQQYCLQNAYKDALLVGVPAGSNPFREPRSCALL
ncbi:uncharacterized protein LOC121314742 isoform X3 [Polyodon spathula]|uniref:uncharacterized protein LOC121314742 isoform X3 n=1 Tax=Polyodon spathula TaxID=7913 RepID=UPI001B7E196D|nr:uncharacterized protein LOC121314742 isoform X3 [Polyodon spathula]